MCKAFIVFIVILSVALMSSNLFAMGKRPAQSPPQTSAVESTQPELEIVAQEESKTESQAKAQSQASISLTSSVAAAKSMDTPEVVHIKEIQTALNAAGFDPGPIDGKMGRRTRRAVMDFQAAKGLTVDGKVGPKTWAELEKYLSKRE